MAIREDGARLDLAATRVWGGRFERALFDIWVLTLMLVQILSTPSLLHMQCVREKRRHYEEGVRKVKHTTFVPLTLVFSATGDQGKTAHRNKTTWPHGG